MIEIRIYILTSILLLISISAFGQNDLTDSIMVFNANCSEAINPEDSTITEFSLINYRTTKSTTLLNFEIIANCAQINRGRLKVLGDSLLISETDAKPVEQIKTLEIDSVGNKLEIITETYLTEIAFCDCLVNFGYELSTPLNGIGFLKFYERTFKLNTKE